MDNINKKQKQIICFDIDNTICKTPKDNNYSKSIPNKKVIHLINSLYNRGFIIKIFTARYMGRFNDDYQKTFEYGYKKTLNQMKKWKINFHSLHMGKPKIDLLIDDRAINASGNWIGKLKKKIEIMDNK
jgi:hypothetical protein